MRKIASLLVCILITMTTFSQADKAKYYIEGDYSIIQGSDGQFIYQLSNIISKGIYFSNTETIIGKKEADESISFTFDKATTDSPEGFAAGMKFWKWQSDGKNYNWQRDSEVKDSQQEYETDKVMVVMLVLDCSKSLGADNFEKLKNSATKFINILYNASSDGSIRLGIIGFNTMGNTDQMVRDIEPLNINSRDKMTQFIQNLTLYNNTALYYAMHKGADMISNYANNLSREEIEKFDYACMVSFTDGYDNHSIDAKIGIPEKGLENPYFQYVRDNVVNRKVNDATLKSFVIAVKGNDVSENNQLYHSVFEGISSEEPILLSDFNELELQFEKMAQQLVKRWQNLMCYVPSAHQGKVRWTLGNETSFSNPISIKDTTSKLKKLRGIAHNPFIGLNGGLNFEIATKFYLGLGLGLNLAFPQEKYAVGGFMSFNYCFSGPLHINLGPLFITGDYNTEMAFLVGAGLDLRCSTTQNGNRRKYPELVWERDRMGAGFVLRAGMTMPSHLYFLADFTLGGYKANYHSVDPDKLVVYSTYPHKYFNCAIHVGYRFGK